MAVKNPQFEINVRKNTNTNNPGYGKYYPKAKEKQTISLRGLTNHMASHNCIYGRDIIEGVLTKMSSCITELLSQGNPVKIDGLGTFVPTVESTKEGITKEALIEGKWNVSTYVKAIHIRFRPEGSGEDDIPSLRALKADYPDAEIMGHCELEGVHKACPSFSCQEYRDYFEGLVN